MQAKVFENKILLLIENKLIICALGNLHYKISRANLNQNWDLNLRISRPALYHLSYPGSHASLCSNLPPSDGCRFSKAQIMSFF